MTFSKTVEKLEARGQKFEGFLCLTCFFANKRTVIFNYRRNHLVKVHDYDGRNLANEMDLEEKNTIDADRFLILLGGDDIICPHCSEKLEKYTTVDDSDFVVYTCDNKKCSYKKSHNHHFQTEELYEKVEKKKFFCSRHRWNHDSKKCNSCMISENFNKNIAPELNRIVGRILKH